VSGSPPWPPYVRPGNDQDLRPVLEGLSLTERQPLHLVEAGQRAQFAWLWSWVRRQVPWYARPEYPAVDLAPLVQQPGAFEAAFRSLPLLAKATLREHERLLVPRSLPAAHKPVSTVKTSGSVGIPVQVGKNSTARLLWNALTVREHLWQRRDFSKRLGAIRFLDRDDRGITGRVLPSWGRPVSLLYTSGPSGAIHIGLPLDAQARFITGFNPNYLLTYPSIARALLDLLGPAGKPPALEQVRLMSEPVDADLRERLAAEWGVGVADVYSANEVGNIALQCERGTLHVQSESLRVEILRADGSACGPGETGKVVITDLHNLATPLIRYDIGDYATVGEPCACGRTLPVLREVRGRVRNLARAPDGKAFWPVSLGLVRRVAAVRQAQFVQTAPDAIEVRVVLSGPIDEADRGRLIDATRRALGHPYRVTVVDVPAIPRGPTGKYEEFLSLLES
jgi:phenylacetate-CoA ligase